MNSKDVDKLISILNEKCNNLIKIRNNYIREQDKYFHQGVITGFIEAEKIINKFLIHYHKKESKSLTCPFCGEEIEILICDAEGNVHSKEYEENPWSGLRYAIGHSTEKECPIATFDEEILGTYLYETRQELIEKWNRRIDVV